MYNLICIIGESGSGKDTILHDVVENCKKLNIDINKVVRCTTRPIRDNEVNGINYFYLSTDTFAEKILNGDLIEVSSFNDWFYGTELSKLSEEKVNIGIYDPDSISCMMEEYRNLVKLWVYYIEASGKTRLIRQLSREKEPDIDEIIRRYEADELDFKYLEFDYNIIRNEESEDLSEAINIITNDIYTIDLLKKKVKNN